jgi:CRISPR/Cas system-associated exonuclease Cas4 (RecB family)
VPEQRITASEISDYEYCRRSWWLARHGVKSAETPALVRGREAHNTLTREIVRRQRRARVGCLFPACVLLVVLVAAIAVVVA